MKLKTPRFFLEHPLYIKEQYYGRRKGGWQSERHIWHWICAMRHTITLYHPNPAQPSVPKWTRIVQICCFTWEARHWQQLGNNIDIKWLDKYNQNKFIVHSLLSYYFSYMGWYKLVYPNLTRLKGGFTQHKNLQKCRALFTDSQINF